MTGPCSYYVYIYYDPRNNVPVYVGKGAVHKAERLRRAYLHWKVFSVRWPHKTPFFALLNKLRTLGLEPIIKIYRYFDSDARAVKCERYLIAKIGRADQGKGTLLNLTDGGDGAGGRILTEAQRKLRSEISKEMWQRPGYRELVVSKVTEALSVEHCRQENAERFRTLWQQPEYRARQVANIIEFNHRPEVKAKRSKTSKKHWARPEYRQKALKGILAYTSDPSYSETKAVAMRALWADPEWRAAQLSNIRTAAARRREERSHA